MVYRMAQQICAQSAMCENACEKLINMCAAGEWMLDIQLRDGDGEVREAMQAMISRQHETDDKSGEVLHDKQATWNI